VTAERVVLDSSRQGDVRGCAIELVAVTRLYGTGSDAPGLHGIDLSVRPGEFVAVTGPSGSGKTTLLNLIGGLDVPDSGRVRVGRLDLTAAGPAELAEYRLRDVGIVFQSYELIPELTVFNNIALPGLLARMPGKRLTARVGELLASVGLPGAGSRHPHELSGGERQRVAIARALMNHPSLIVADEPTGNLDTAAGSVVLELLAAANKAGATLVLVSHDRNVAARASRQVAIVDGHLA
jgi:putative ABC transport system ATP-binding protein